MCGPKSSIWKQMFSILGTASLGLAWYGYGIAASAAADSNSGHSKLYKHEHALIALSKLRGDKDVVILVAARTGKIAEAVGEFTKLGGEVHFRADDVDYLR
ncbi:MAG TPA: hypothetical protein VNO32_28140, partial [Candidatus Acidoferrum sp.]|nr:hypothetical protein [Candidatus Acidoferrum sp.]